jgi:4-amino-4-deoxy-L-arabinose transferase-like glycosyltransferase
VHEAWRGRLLRGATVAALAAGLALLGAGIAHSGTPGWDATGHAFAALRMAQALREFDLGRFFEQFHQSDFYPPVGRLGYVLAFLLDGNGFAAPRAINAAAWIAAIFLATRIARHLAGEARADTAAFFTAVLGLTSWVGIVYARCTYTEPWSALANGATILLYLRLRGSGRRLDAALVGVALGLALLVKYTYGIQLAVAVGVTGLVELVRGPDRRATVRVGALLALGLAAVLLWWFVLPLPYGPATGRAHAEAFGLYLTKASSLPTRGPEFVLVAWPVMSFLSLAAVALQLAGFALGLRSWRSEAHRLCLLLGLIGPIAFTLYPFRIDRFLIPALPAGWALAGAVAAVGIARCTVRVRPWAGVALLALLLGTAGLGAESLVRLAYPGLPAVLPAQTEANLAAWRWPYTFRRAPGAGPAGTEEVLDFASAHLHAREPFAWIGGTGTEIPLALVQWTLFRTSGETAALWREPDAQDHFWQDPGWDEEAFRGWARGFPQLVTLDPPDPRDRAGRDFERDFVAWMRQNPDFDELASERVDFDGTRPHTVTVYRRREGARR